MAYTKEQREAKAAAQNKVETTEVKVEEMKTVLVGLWKNKETEHYETVEAVCNPKTGEVKFVETKNAGVLQAQAFDNLKKLIISKGMNKV